MMKMFFQCVVLVFVCYIIICCQSTKQSVNEDEWKEMEQFHMVIAEAIHPYIDSANLTPAIQLAPELVAVATRWADAPLPSRVNTDDVKHKLDRLVQQAKVFQSNVLKEDIDTMGESLHQLHNLFHEIHNAWYGKGDSHKHSNH